ncbi:derlin-1 [Ischnura elegans]|uniref:derlin-1 n=1 Tax=Ischnura elegans TaxID=197161 RepID=UPI001ED89598|nr:derlin-1 [Ischnura elegans]XP_046386648.1 derlin-1 [Ischnura elegans]
MSDIADWYKSLPIFTRWWLGLTVAFSVLGRFGLINNYSLILLYEPFVRKFQIWRPATALFYYPLTPSTGFHFMINLYFLYNYSLRLETGVFDGRPADYLFMLLFNWICCVIVGLLVNIPLLMDPMVLSVLYVWCQLNKDVIVNFWFGSQFKAMYLPWVLFAFKLIISGGGILELVGIMVGHLYFFLMFTYPQELGGPSLLKTPGILYEWFPNRQGGIHGFGQAPTSRREDVRAAGGGFGRNQHNWGRGNVLGGN